MRPLRIGVVPLARTTFDIPLAEKIWQHTLQALTSPQVSVLGPDGLITDVDSAYSTASTLSEAPPDLLVILQATFADSTMVTTLAERIDSPILLWAVPEERTGGRLRLNSLCGINLAAHALTLRGQRYSYVYAPPGDPAAHERVLTRARAGDDHACWSVQLWQAGVLDRVPPEIHHGMIACARDGDGWVILMEDLTACLLPHAPFSLKVQDVTLEAMAALHVSFFGAPDLLDPSLGLCRLNHVYSMFSRQTGLREAGGLDEIPQRILEGWDLFRSIVAKGVVDVLESLLADPRPLTNALSRFPDTLIHGDWRHANEGLISADWWEPQLRLGLLGGFLQDGWAIVLKATHWHIGAGARPRWKAAIAWWSEQVRACLKWL